MAYKKTRLILISFDAVGDRVFDWMTALPHVSTFLWSAALVRDVRSVFVTNTYPIHASVVTGLPPSGHGLVSNAPAFPQRYSKWNYRSNGIKAKTLWKAAAEKGFSQGAVLWPVTGGNRNIRWNLPEIMPRPGVNQLLVNLLNGTKLMQLRLYFKYRYLLEGISQPARDRFATACMADILRHHQPDLAFMHFTAYDSLCHHHGEDRSVLEKALRALDQGLGDILEASVADGDPPAVIIFSDHAQLPVSETLLPNDMLVELGLLKKQGEQYIAGESFCFIECCGGSAFFHPGNLGAGDIDRVRQRIEVSRGFNRWLREAEMAECGLGGLGFCAKPGWQYAPCPSDEKSQHGYPPDYEDYGVFYAIRGPGIVPGRTVRGGSILDIAPLALRILGEGLPPKKRPQIPGLGPARTDLFRG
ncbi:MAG: ectonucleotide pyrophosphatase/phosphodiesterase [Treponema sp.]|jgi:predicted AlkP superfamily pyrophosphatase or phosphodiesterase|nr:ectonucleotide pyrophosphatase/phosphodiesterase [Treponema sp.]